MLPDVERAPLQGPFASRPTFALIEGSLLSPIPGFSPFPIPGVVLGVVPTPGDKIGPVVVTLVGYPPVSPAPGVPAV